MTRDEIARAVLAKGLEGKLVRVLESGEVIQVLQTLKWKRALGTVYWNMVGISTVAIVFPNGDIRIRGKRPNVYTPEEIPALFTPGLPSNQEEKTTSLQGILPDLYRREEHKRLWQEHLARQDTTARVNNQFKKVLSFLRKE